MISTMTYFDFVVETKLLNRHFAVVIVTVAVGVVSVPAKLNKFPPTLNLVLWVSSFWGLISQNNRSYVNFLVSKETIVLITTKLCQCSGFDYLHLVPSN